MLGQQVGLLLLRVTDGVHAEFGEDERFVARQVLQAREIADEVALAMEINIVAVEIDLARQQVFGRRKIRVGRERARVVLLDDADEPVEEFLHARRAVPAHEVGRNFIVDEKAEHGRVTGVGDGGLGHVALDRPHGLTIVEEEDALVPRNGDHDADALGQCQIEEPPRGGVIDADDIDAEFAHEAQIERGFFRCRQLRAVWRGGTERSVGHALQVKFLVTFEKKLRARDKARKFSHGWRRGEIMHGAKLLPSGRWAAS